MVLVERLLQPENLAWVTDEKLDMESAKTVRIVKTLRMIFLLPEPMVKRRGVNRSLESQREDLLEFFEFVKAFGLLKFRNQSEMLMRFLGGTLKILAP